ncbi:MAG: hypothetical protein H0X22_09505 [Acidimicrobiia bacterium]|nr:hypothetical protein [Acidimicrobiia bacterium]
MPTAICTFRVKPDSLDAFLGLQHELHGFTDQVHAVTGAEGVQQIGHGRL